MDEREVTALGWRLRRTLATLDDIGVPMLDELIAPRRAPLWRTLAAPVGVVALLASAVVVAAGINEWRAAMGRAGVGSQPTAANAPVDALTLPASRYLDSGGYRFTVSVVADARYRSGAGAAEFSSAVDGVAVRCTWDRLGVELPYVDGAFGGADRIEPTRRVAPAQSGARSESTMGVPASVTAASTAVVCGAVDAYGSHGVRGLLELRADGRAPISALRVEPWSGAIGDAAAVTPCTGKDRSNQLVAAYASTADELATWIENAAYPNAPQLRDSAFRTSYSPRALIYLCYFSGQYAPSVPPPGPGQTATPAGYYDRALLFVDVAGNVVPPQTIGSGRTLPLARPGGRF